MDASHAQKWRRREAPPSPASTNSRGEMRFQARHSRVAVRNAPTMRSENPRRQTAITTGSALERRTSGPANAIPSSESASIQYGFPDMTKKRAGAVSTGSLFQTTLVGLLGFDQSHLFCSATRVSQNLVVVGVAVGRVAASDAAVVAQQRFAHVRRIVHRLLEDLHAVADVALHVEQVLRAA